METEWSRRSGREGRRERGEGGRESGREKGAEGEMGRKGEVKEREVAGERARVRA